MKNKNKIKFKNLKKVQEAMTDIDSWELCKVPGWFMPLTGK